MKRDASFKIFALVIYILFSCIHAFSQVKHPKELDWIDYFVEKSIKQKKCPGAVVLAGVNFRRVYFKAFGMRAISPGRERMTRDTIFDLASVTKPVATAFSIMKLWETGKLDLDECVSKYLPEFSGKGKEKIKVRHLLTHHSGLTPDNPLRDYLDGPEKAWERICRLPLLSPPGERFRYSDVGFIVLGKLVERVSGMKLDAFARKYVFGPIGMKHTFFNPPDNLKRKIAPTQRLKGRILRGIVHDPRARLLGGVAGHAGLFSTAQDLEKICLMLLGSGEYKGKRIFEKRTIEKMTTLPRNGNTHGRALGWDVDSPYSSPRGMWLTRGVSFGHSGFTGTSLWIDPKVKAYVIVLTNRVHPDGKGNVISLRRQIANAFGRSLGLHEKGVIPGIEVLSLENFKGLEGSGIGLITNHTGRTRDGISDIDIFYRAKGLKLICLFSPEHGIRGVLDRPVENHVDEETGLPVYSLYGKTKRPLPRMLEGVDTLVFDIQDIGTRFYTYISTMLYSMEEAAKRGIRFVVLDRPDPIGGKGVYGPLTDPDSISFTACARIPVVHGMTVGELAVFFKKTRKMKVELKVVKMKGWRRSMRLDETGIPWINPSPNMTSLEGAILYPAIGLLEATNLSVGRGTRYPFRVFGSPWMDAERVLQGLKAMNYKALRFERYDFKPKWSKFKGKECKGIRIRILQRDGFDPVCLGLRIGRLIRKIHGKKFEFDKINVLLKSRKTLEMLKSGCSIEAIRNSWLKELGNFLEKRKGCLLYD